MVSKANIKELDFNTIEEYYNYILESVYNGQRQQARELLRECSKQQLKDCLVYMNDSEDSEQIEEVKNLIMEIL